MCTCEPKTLHNSNTYLKLFIIIYTAVNALLMFLVHYSLILSLWVRIVDGLWPIMLKRLPIMHLNKNQAQNHAFKLQELCSKGDYFIRVCQTVLTALLKYFSKLLILCDSNNCSETLFW